MEKERVLNELLAFYERNGMKTFQEIAIHFGFRDPRAFRKFLDAIGLSEDFPDITLVLRKKIKVFDILTEESCYWLGYIMADGCITDTRLMLECQVSDEEILIKFCDYLGIRKSRITIGHKGASRCLCLSKSRFSTFPKEYGILERKTFLENHIDKRILSEKRLFFQFFRGYFDGDGCVNTSSASRNISIVGDYALLSDFKKGIEMYIEDARSVWFEEITKKDRKVELWQLTVGLGGQERKMSNALFSAFYDGQKIVLTRKYNSFKRII